MRKTRHFIIHNARSLIHKSGHLANKHKHILLSYMHICLVVLGFWLYYVVNSMFAQTGDQTIITEDEIIQTYTNEIINKDENINDEQNDNLSWNIQEITWDVQEITWDIQEITWDIQEITWDVQEITWDVQEITWDIQEITWDVQEITWDVQEITWDVQEITWDVQEITWDITIEIKEIDSPIDVENLEAWFDANKSNSIIQSWNNVQERKDRRWFSHKAFAKKENKQPLYVENIINNYPAIFFDNIDDELETNIRLQKEYTLFLVYNKEITPWWFASAIGSNEKRFVWFDQNNFIFFASGGVNIPSYRWNNSFKAISISTNSWWTIVHMNNNEITILQKPIESEWTLKLGILPLGWYIAEILIYDRWLSNYEITEINKYLIRKYSPFTSNWLPVTDKTLDDTKENNINQEDKKLQEIENKEISITKEEDTNKQIIETKVKKTDTNIEKIEIEEEIENKKSDSYFSNPFQKDEQNQLIGDLQKFLYRYWVYNWEINNTYDQRTIEAIYQFQLKESILKWQEDNKKVQWYMGPSTRKRINEVWITFTKSNQKAEEDQKIDTIKSWETEQETNKKDKNTIFKEELCNLGFLEETKKDKKILIGKKWFDLERTEWLIPQATIITKEESNFIGEIIFPENTIIKTNDNSEYTWIIDFFPIENKESQQWVEHITTFKAGAEEPIFLQDDIGNDKNATIKITLPEYYKEKNIIIQYSQDGNEWKYFDTIKTQSEENWVFASFQTNHFTIFSLGIWSGNFVINNDEISTTSNNVTLQTNITGATHMKFGNTPSERDSANRVTYDTNYPRTLTGANWEKTVYGIFSGNWGFAYIQDTIYLDTTPTQESLGLQLHVDGSYTGTYFYDISSNNYLANSINNVYTTTLSWLPTMSFNGTNQYINITQPIVSTYPFTISAWVKPDRITWTQWIVFKGRSNSNNRYFWINLNNATFQITARNTVSRTANGTISAQAWQWYHVVGIFNSATSRTIYVNGIQWWTSTNSVTLDTTSQHQTIWKYAGTTTNYFSGSIDEVRIYNKTLTNQEIQNLYMKAPSFSPKTVFTKTPVLEWTSPDKNMNIEVIINGINYPTTNYQNGTWKTNIIPELNSWVYNVTLNYINIYWRTGSITYPNGLTVYPVRTTNYSQNNETFDNVIATITWYGNNYVITNNNWSNQYTFSGNGEFIYKIQSITGITYESIAKVDWIKKWLITGTNLIFDEDDILNNGQIKNTISFELTWHTFNNNAPTNGSITMSWVPAGLTTNFYLSGTQTLIVGLSWTAINHANNNDINTIEIRFWNWAFTNAQDYEIINSTITWIKINFMDPYVGLQLYPSDDTMIDADTDITNGCGDGICQENNYWAMQYLCASDFWSRVLMKFNVSSIPVGSKITSAKLRLSRYYITSQASGMSFSLRPIINNPWWVEWTKSNSTASIGELNYKMIKRQEKYRHNGNIGMVNGIDYGTTNITNTLSFSGAIGNNITQEFSLNSNWLSRVQNWLDNPDTNQWIAMWDSNDYWLCIRSKEYWTIGERPMLTLTYAADNEKPQILSTSPYTNETNVGLYNNLIINFDENIRAYTGFSIYIKKTHDNSIFETIDAGSNKVIINNTTATILHWTAFENFTWYYIEIQSGAFRDIAGNSFPGIIGSWIWKFTTVNLNEVPIITGNITTNITENTALATANILSIGNSTITERWFYRSTANWFNDGIWTKVSEYWNRSNTGTFSLNLTGLPWWTWIYFKGFAINNYWTKYTTQSGFLTKPEKPIFKPANYLDNDWFRINRESTTWATIYKLRVSTTNTFSTTISWYSGKVITDTKETITWLQKETRYYYKIQAINSAGESQISEIQSTQTTWLPAARSWLEFEEPSGSTTFDSSLNNNYWILLWWVIRNQTGVNGKAFQFDGVNDEVSIVDFEYGPDLSVSFRLKTNSTGNNMYLFSHWDSGAVNSINIVLNNSDKMIKTFINGQQTILNLNSSTYTTLTNNERHLYTLTIDDNWEIPGKKKATVYIDGIEKISNSSIDAWWYNPINNITLARRSANQANTFYKWMLDDVRIYNKTLTPSQVYNLYAEFVDNTPPTAYIEYSHNSWSCYNGDIIATLTGYSEPIVITNNQWSNTYTFTENGTFTFTFRDEGFNTGIAIASVNRICKNPLNIWWPSMINANIEATSDLQIVEQQFNDYFWIEDPIWTDNWYYTTISISDLSWDYENIDNSNIYLKWDWITLLSGDSNRRVTINSSLTNYQPIGNPITYIKRDNQTNYGITWKYWNKPRLRFDIPAFISIDAYHATLTYTLYEN